MPSKLNLDSNETLKQGAKGQKVQQLQEILTALNLNPGTIDGDFGNNTLKAVKQFQSQKGLEADGVVGKKTQDALNDALGQATTSAPSS
ncbi:MAG: peptidoglycan-binding domain-containing protein, partial [Dolichospermum sp.]